MGEAKMIQMSGFSLGRQKLMEKTEENFHTIKCKNI